MNEELLNEECEAFTEMPVVDGESVKNTMLLTHLYRAAAASLEEYRAQLREQRAVIDFAISLSDDEIRRVWRKFGVKEK